MAKAKTSYLPAPSTPRTLDWLWANTRFQSQYPALFEILSAGMYEGEPRKGGTVTIYCGDGRLKASISDRHTGQTMFVDLEPSQDILGEIEAAITGGKHQWKSGRNGDAKPVF